MKVLVALCAVLSLTAAQTNVVNSVVYPYQYGVKGFQYSVVTPHLSSPSVVSSSVTPSVGSPSVVSSSITPVTYSSSVSPITYSSVSPITYSSSVSPITYSSVSPITYTSSVSPITYSAPYVYSNLVSPSNQVVSSGIVTPSVVSPSIQYHSQDIFGRASYGHVDPYQAQSAVQDAAGNKVGSFSYVTPEGKVVNTRYVADALGYRVQSDSLPVSPVVNSQVVNVPVVQANSVPVVQTSSIVHETPEVVATRIVRNSEDEAKSRTRRSAETPASTSRLEKQLHVPVVSPVVPYQYTYPVSYSPVTYSTVQSPVVYPTVYNPGYSRVVYPGHAVSYTYV